MLPIGDLHVRHGRMVGSQQVLGNCTPGSRSARLELKWREWSLVPFKRVGDLIRHSVIAFSSRRIRISVHMDIQSDNILQGHAFC